MIASGAPGGGLYAARFGASDAARESNQQQNVGDSRTMHFNDGAQNAGSQQMAGQNADQTASKGRRLDRMGVSSGSIGGASTSSFPSSPLYPGIG